MSAIPGEGGRVLWRSPARGAGTVVAAPTRLRKRLEYRAVGRLRPGKERYACLDADCRSKAGHLVRDVPEYSVPRVLPPTGLPAFRLRGFPSHTRLLRARSAPLPPCAWHAPKTPLLAETAVRSFSH